MTAVICSFLSNFVIQKNKRLWQSIILQKKRVYQISQQENGFIQFTPQQDNAGLIIHSAGGIEAFLARCLEDPRSLEEISQDTALIVRMVRRNGMLDQEIHRSSSKPSAQQIEEAYLELIQQGVIEVNTRNLLTVMRHLNSVNWGSWELPSMDQSYQARQYFKFRK